MKINHRVPLLRHEDKDENEVLIASEIFRAYDIRGIYPKEINEKTAYFIGRAFVKFLKKRKPNIVIGRDNRLSSPALFEGLVKGIIDEGGKVIDVGLSTTPMFYFAVAHFYYDGGINITASHLSKEYNGFKLVREKAIPISERTGLKKIQTLIKSRLISDINQGRGKVIRKKILRDYLKFNLKDFDFRKLKPLKIVIDTANSVPGILIPGLKKELPIKIYSLFEKLDGSFPNHNPDPLIKENLRFLQKEVRKKKANFGVAFDGDGDRIIFVDEKGEIIPGDLITALMADLILRENPKARILYDIRSSNIVRETIERGGGFSIVNRIGHSLFKERMRKERGIFGGEFSGHYYHKDHYFSEVPLYVLFKILEKISESKKKLSGLILPYQKYFHSGEINFEVKNKEKVLAKLEKKYTKGQISHLDGLRVDFKDWWFLVRPSHTEPVLRLVVEAKTKKLMEKKKKEISSLIQSN